MALVIAEGVYRVVLYFQERGNASSKPIIVSNDSVAKFDDKAGFHYPADAQIIMASIEPNSGRVHCSTILFNQQGNQGRACTDYAEGDLKILMFGDSFLATVGDGLTMSNVLQDRLGDRLGKKVRILNFGRDGYGILRMVDLAAAKIPEYKPDLAIIVFITDDLDRARWWRKEGSFEGIRGLYYTLNPNVSPDPNRDTLIFYINPRVTREWCSHMKASPGRTDVLFQQIVQEYTALKVRQRADIGGFTRFSRSFVLTRLFHKDPFHGLYSPQGEISKHWRVEFTDFRQDADFV